MITTNEKTKPAEDDGMGFHPGFPPGFDPKRAEKGLGQDNETWTIPPTINQALHAALHHVQDAAERWSLWQENGATDKELMAAIGREFGIAGGSTDYDGYRYKGGKSPEFSWPGYADQSKAQTLKGKRLLAKVREVLDIGAPGQPTEPDDWETRELKAPIEYEDEATSVDPEKKRLHEAAVARWRRERPASADAGESSGYHPQMLQMIPVGNIEPSPTNPRKYFNPDKLQELADSISEHGLVEPILVRPLSAPHDDIPLYQLVAGERRWRAAKLAGLKEIEAKVRGLDDKAVLEIQFIENLQRSDLSAIEEAEGYKRLLEEHGYTADSLAGKLAKSKSYVYGRLKLCNLPPAALDALAKGDLPATIGELIGRLPSMELREKFWEDNFSDYATEYFDPPSYRDVKLTIEQQYMRELKGSPFNQADAKLLPGVPSCKKCPKRTGNNRADYPDGRADICTDVACFKLKVEASNKRLRENAAAEGVRVLSEKEINQWFPYGDHLAWGKQDEFVDLDDECYDALTEKEQDEDKPAPTYGALLGEIKPDVVATTKAGTLHRLVAKERAAEILRGKHGIEIETPLGRHLHNEAKVNPQVLKQREEDELKRKARGLAFERIAEKVAAWYDQEFLVRSVNGAGALANLLRVIAYQLLRNFDDWTPVSDTLKRRDALNTTEEVGDSDEFAQVAAKLVKDADAADLIGILAEVCVREELQYWSRAYDRSDLENTICDFAGLKIDEFEKQALKELKGEKKTKAKTKAKAAATA